jgi:hypothetical protein
MNKAIDASDLGLKPGEWPRTITVEGHVYSKGQRMVNRDEFAGYVYVSDDGTVTVYND